MPFTIVDRLPIDGARDRPSVLFADDTPSTESENRQLADGIDLPDRPAYSSEGDERPQQHFRQATQADVAVDGGLRHPIAPGPPLQKVGLRLDRPPFEYLSQLRTTTRKIFVVANATDLFQKGRIVHRDPVLQIIETLRAEQHALRYFDGTLLCHG